MNNKKDFFGLSKRNKPQQRNVPNNKSDRATQVLDIMESYHEPNVEVYDKLIASHGEAALQCLSYLSRKKSREQSDIDEDDESNDYSSLYYQQAWKHSKSALQLLNRAEDLYFETGQLSTQLPSVSSYVNTIDVYKALAMSVEDIDEKSKRDEALEVVRALRRRRVDVYSLDKDTENVNRGEYSILPLEVNNMKTEEVLEYAANILFESEPTYKFVLKDSTKIGTFHFNQLIFDISDYSQPFAGPLAQDLLDYMIYMVKKAAPLSHQQRRHQQPNIPKPNFPNLIIRL